ncbi:MAG: hypothetical protein LBU37_07500 [Tannerellaceae bacterium]|jgi:hypothetical protein|nr:hypothetical protein [Tannerellaceae bacterium]
MIHPTPYFAPLTAIWYQFAHLLERLVSSALLTLVFFLVVTPMGLTRRLLGKDSLSLRQFGKSNRSVLKDRPHLYTKEDMIHTF